MLKLSTEQEYKLTMKWIKTSFYDLIINNIRSINMHYNNHVVVYIVSNSIFYEYIKVDQKDLPIYTISVEKNCCFSLLCESWYCNQIGLIGQNIQRYLFIIYNIFIHQT